MAGRDHVAKEVKTIVKRLRDQETPIGYQGMKCHMVFDVKMEQACSTRMSFTFSVAVVCLERDREGVGKLVHC